MLIDACSLPVDEIVDAEVCIVGAGPAGITLARELANQNFRVCLLESGGLEYNEATQSLYEGETLGDPYQSPYETRRRQFGGTANAWGINIGENQIGVRHVPLDEIDFEKRDWLPYSGWPFSKADLDPFYERAQAICGVGPYAYSAEAWADAHTPQLPLVGDRVTTTMFQFGPRALFTHEYRDEIKRAGNITTYLNANVVDIEANETGTTVTRVRVACLQGNQFWVQAKLFILATGGIENARLLLLSNKVQKNGLGNQNDLVGRFFMDHPMVHCGMLVPTSRQIFNQTALYDLRRVNDVAVMGKLTLTRAAMQREQLLNISAILYPRPKTYRSDAFDSFRKLLGMARQHKISKDAIQHLSNVLSDLGYVLPIVYNRVIEQSVIYPDLGLGGWSQIKHKDKTFVVFQVFHQTEQAPDPNNRVTLGTECDRLGRNKVQVHWRWTDIDIRSIQRAQAIFAEDIACSGLGELRVEQENGLPQICSPAGTHHHMGTTRMHLDPKQGVVDANCKVHGISNLFIAGSSVFPTGGYANPTLTIVALAARLADHVKTLMGTNRATVLHHSTPTLASEAIDIKQSATLARPISSSYL